MYNAKSSCSTRVIAQSEYCSISHCEHCNSYHLHIGPMSLHLQAAVFENICEVLFQVYAGMQQTKSSSEMSEQNVRHH